MVNIRSPFLAMESGIAATTTAVFRQKDRRNKVGQHHAGDNQHQARSQAAAFLSDLEGESWDREDDSVLGNRNSES